MCRTVQLCEANSKVLFCRVCCILQNIIICKMDRESCSIAIHFDICTVDTFTQWRSAVVLETKLFALLNTF
jgi:hypothetical protein